MTKIPEEAREWSLEEQLLEIIASALTDDDIRPRVKETKDAFWRAGYRLIPKLVALRGGDLLLSEKFFAEYHHIFDKAALDLLSELKLIIESRKAREIFEEIRGILKEYPASPYGLDRILNLRDLQAFEEKHTGGK